MDWQSVSSSLPPLDGQMLPLLLLSVVALISAQTGPLSPEENRRLQATCGSGPAPQRRSMFGPEVEPEEAPWAGALGYAGMWYPEMSEEKLVARPRCSGSLISSGHFITAAHCVVTNKECKRLSRNVSAVTPLPNLARLRVYVGTTCVPYMCRQNDREDTSIRRRVVRAFVPKRYGCDDHHNYDLAVLELEEDVPTNLARIRPACLPQSEKYTLEIGEKLEYAGFGLDDAQNKAHLDSIGIMKGSTEYVKKCPVTKLKNYNDKDIICSGSPFLQTCNGDSGGGYVRRRADGDHVELVALVSKGAPCSTYLKFHRIAPPEDLGAIRGIQQLLNDHLSWICVKTGICSGKTSGDMKTSSVELDELGDLAYEDSFAT